jgi:hypothetical protein
MRLIVIALLMTFATHVGADPINALVSAIEKVDADIVFMRRTIAPSFGAPPDFDLQDCGKQRNLDQSGKNQAALIGDKLRDSHLQLSRSYQVIPTPEIIDRHVPNLSYLLM